MWWVVCVRVKLVSVWWVVCVRVKLVSVWWVVSCQDKAGLCVVGDDVWCV